jgi:hypothetical protein
MWTEDFLASRWPDTMAKVTARQPLVFVIDGLDEIQTECRESFLGCLGEFEKKLETLKLEGKPEKTSDLEENTGPWFRILLLSREDTELKMLLSKQGFQHYPVTPADTRGDVNKTVKAGLGRIWNSLRKTDGSQSLREEACRSIVEGSKGNYLWATLVVEYLGRTKVVSEIQIIRLVRWLPGDVQRLYHHILLEIVESARGYTYGFFKQVIRWALFQNARLKPAEFNIAQALGIAIEAGPAKMITTRGLEDSLDDNIKIRVDVCCGHLVQFRDEQLDFVHGSLRSFLLAQGSELFAGQNLDLNLDEGVSHAALADICIVYLNMPYFSDSGAAPTPATMDLWESKVRRRIKDHAFVRYAALNWYQHVAEAGRSWPGANIKAVLDRGRLVDGSTEHAKCWAEVWWFFTRGPTVDYPPECPARFIATLNSGRSAASRKKESLTRPVAARRTTEDVPSVPVPDFIPAPVAQEPPGSARHLKVSGEQPFGESLPKDTAGALEKKSVHNSEPQEEPPQEKPPQTLPAEEPIQPEPTDLNPPQEEVPQQTPTQEEPSKKQADMEDVRQQMPHSNSSYPTPRLPGAWPTMVTTGNEGLGVDPGEGAPEQTTEGGLPLKEQLVGPPRKQTIPERRSSQATKETVNGGMPPGKKLLVRQAIPEESSQEKPLVKKPTPGTPLEQDQLKLKETKAEHPSMQLTKEEPALTQSAKPEKTKRTWWTRVKRAGRGLGELKDPLRTVSRLTV